MYEMQSPMNYSLPCCEPHTEAADPVISSYFQRYLLQKAMSGFKFGFPAQWPKNYVLYALFLGGKFAILNTNKYGVIPQFCGLQGFDLFYQPTNAVITNPLLRGIVTPRIGVQCVVVKLSHDYHGISDMVKYYGDMMALCATAAQMNLVNSRVSYVFAAGGKNKAATFKELYERIKRGEPATIVDKDLMNEDGTASWHEFSQNVGQNYIVDKLLKDLRKIEQMFDTAVGIPNANTDKAERLIVDEVNANNVETQALAEMWLENIKEGFEQANKMFGLDLSVEWRHKPGEVNAE